MKPRNPSNDTVPLIVGVGASAGGLDAFRELLDGLGDRPGVAIVLVQHSDPTNKQPLADLLGESTKMEVVTVAGRRKIKPNTVFVCPPDQLAEVHGSVIRLSEEGAERHSSVVDHFFHSIAGQQTDRGIGVVLSGAGSDGTLGIKAISDHGGLTFAQDAESAQFDSMPRSAATTGVADHVMPPREIASEIIRYTTHLNEQAAADSDEPRHDEIAKSLPAICQVLFDVTQHNFQHYKANTLSRRVQRRMQILKIASASDYLKFLKSDDEEPHALFRELLIGVTTFFRDPDVFETLKQKVLKKLFENRRNNDGVRIWVAGCSSGPEAYTMAMLCREVMDELDVHVEVQIFATDIDEHALQLGRVGEYPIGIEDHVSPERLKRFFVKRGKRYHVSKDIRELVLFSAHNLISDPPFSRLDLISCRNLLIYLGPHLQNKLIPLFHYALRPGGHLLLGPSENLTSHQELFRPVDAKCRISQRKGTAAGRTPATSIRNLTTNALSDPPSSSGQTVDMTAIAQRIVLDEFAPKYAVIDESGQVLNSSADLEKYVHFQGGDYQNNLIKIIHPGLRIALRSTLGQAIKLRRRIEHDNLSIRLGDSIQRVMLTVQPMPRLGEDEALFMVVFHDVGLPVESDDDKQRAIQFNSDPTSLLAQMEQELETTRKDLDETLQDMEAANEELKSSNEELLSMNEELQTANEELEASKEEVRLSSDAIARANDDLENLLRSTEIATVFLDDELRIRSFTPAIREIYDLIVTDVGRPLTMFVPKVKEMPPLPTSHTQELPGTATNTAPENLPADASEDTVIGLSGKSFIRRVLPYRSHTGEYEGIVITFTDVTQLTESQERFELLVKASAQVFWMTDADGIVNTDSPSWREFTGQSLDEWMGLGWLNAIHPDDREPTLQQWQLNVQQETPFAVEYRLWHHSGRYRWTQARGIAQRNADGSIRQWIGMNTDIDDRKRNDVELAESRQRLQLGIELGKLGIGRVDYVNNQITLTPEAANLYGLGDQEITVTRDQLHAVFHPDEMVSVNDCITKSFDPAGSRRCDLEHRIVLPDGDVRWINVRKQINFDDSQIPAVPRFATMVAQDVTERKQQEQETADREAHLRRVIDHMLNFVGVLTPEGVLLEVNATALAAGGISREDVIGIPFWECYWWSYDDAIALELKSAVSKAAQGEVVRYDAEVRMAENTRMTIDFMIVPVRDSDGTITHLVPSGVDVSDRVRVEQEIRNANAKLRVLFDQAFYYTGLMDLDGNLTDINDAALDAFGFQRDELVGKPFWDTPWWKQQPDTPERLRTRFGRVLNGETYRDELKFLGPDGSVRVLDFVFTPATDDDNRVIFVVANGRDVTQQREFEQQLEQRRREAQAANEAKSAFVANMSHEIRTPMTAILGYADLIREHLSDAEAISHLQTIRRNGHYLLEIINDILDLSKIESGKLDVDHERFDPSLVVEDVRSFMEVRATEANLQFDVEYATKIPALIQSDAKRLKQILINLIGNAIKFTNEGLVKIRVSFDDLLTFEIVDTGIGMSEEQSEKLFLPFQQGDSSVSRKFGGTGLGLAISRRLAEVLGGDITVESHLNQGSVFTVTIAIGDFDDVKLVKPRTDAESVERELESEVPQKENVELSGHVLVVDDRRDIRFLSRRILTKAGATVEEAEDGNLAVAAVKHSMDQNQSFDLIVLDMQMPNLDGYETAAELRRLGYAGPIIALTADAMQGDMKKCLQAGCNDYLSKPIDADKLIQLASRLIQSR